MLSIRPLQRLLLAGILSLISGLALAGGSPPPSSNSDNDDTDKVVAVALGFAIMASINCAMDTPSIPGCEVGGSSTEGGSSYGN